MYRDVRDSGMALSDAAGRPEKGTGRVILYLWCFTFLAAYAYAKSVKPLIIMRDEAMAIAKRVTIVCMSSIIFDDSNAPIPFKKYKKISAIKYFT